MGIIHLASSILALVFGTLILVWKKGTRRHKYWGYAYVISMAALNISAFTLYKLFGGFGIFHIAAIVSSLTLIAGMVPVIRRRPAKKYILVHFSFMYWSVTGLYAAFASEVLTRVPETPFFGMVGIATGIIVLVAYIFLNRMKEKWAKEFISFS